MGSVATWVCALSFTMLKCECQSKITWITSLSFYFLWESCTQWEFIFHSLLLYELLFPLTWTWKGLTFVHTAHNWHNEAQQLWVYSDQFLSSYLKEKQTLFHWRHPFSEQSVTCSQVPPSVNRKPQTSNQMLCFITPLFTVKGEVTTCLTAIPINVRHRCHNNGIVVALFFPFYTWGNVLLNKTFAKQ